MCDNLDAAKFGGLKDKTERVVSVNKLEADRVKQGWHEHCCLLHEEGLPQFGEEKTQWNQSSVTQWNNFKNVVKGYM